jgi:hypothetical protein
MPIQDQMLPKTAILRELSKHHKESVGEFEPDFAFSEVGFLLTIT